MLGEGGESIRGRTSPGFCLGDLLDGVPNDVDSHLALALVARFNIAEGLLEEMTVSGIAGNV